MQVHIRSAHACATAVSAHASVHRALVVFVLVLLAEGNAEPTGVAARGRTVQAVFLVRVDGLNDGVAPRLDLCKFSVSIRRRHI